VSGTIPADRLHALTRPGLQQILEHDGGWSGVLTRQKAIVNGFCPPFANRCDLTNCRAAVKTGTLNATVDDIGLAKPGGAARRWRRWACKVRWPLGSRNGAIQSMVVSNRFATKLSPILTSRVLAIHDEIGLGKQGEAAWGCMEWACTVGWLSGGRKGHHMIGGDRGDGENEI